MKIVIDIPDRLIDNEFGYTDIRLHKDRKHINSITTEDYESPYFACLPFVVLPEHHGKLIDGDVLHDRFNQRCMGDCGCCPLSNDFSCNLIMNADVILEATEEVD